MSEQRQDPLHNSGNKQPEADAQPAEATQTFFNLSQHLRPGSVIADRYRIIEFLGVGGMGRVYRAHDLELQQDIALKLIRPELLEDKESTERFKRELVLARQVSHRNVVRIHDLGEFNKLKYLTMTFVPGRTLKDELRESGPLEPDRAVEVMTQIAEAVKAAHREGVVHRDLKPSNILVDEDDRVYVTDFGIARSMDSDLTRTGVAVGTPAYWSPEQAAGESGGPRSDVYSLGIIFYEILAGKPLKGPAAKALRELAKERPELPGYLLALLHRCLAQDPERRYADGGEIAADLRERHVKRSLVDQIGRPAAWAALLLLALGVAVAVVLWSLGGWGSAGPPDADAYSVVVLPFENQTAQASYDWMEGALADLLISDLARTSDLRVVSEERTGQTLADLRLDPANLDASSLRQISEFLGADLVLQGSLVLAGPTLRADLKVTDSVGAKRPIYLKALGSPDQLFDMVEQLASEVRSALRLKLAGDNRLDPVSLAALQAFEEGSDLLRQGQFEEAIPHLSKAIEEDPGFLKPYLRLSQCYEQLSQWDRAAQVLEQALALEESGNARNRAVIQARYSLLNGALDEAIAIYQRLGQSYPRDADIFFELALALEDAGDLRRAVAALQTVVELDPNHPQAYFHLGKDTILMGQAETAISRHLVRALSIATQLSNRFQEADVLNAMGVAYERLGRNDDSLRYYQQSLEIKREIGNLRGAATTLYNMAKVQISLGHFEEAEDLLGESLETYHQLDYLKGVANVTNLFGVLYEDQGRFTDAIESYKRSLQLRRQIGDDRLTAQSYDNVGYIYYLTGEYDNARVYWDQGLQLRTAIGEESGIVLSLQNMGFLQMAQGELEKALASFLEALQRARDLKYENAIAVSQGNLAQIYQRQGRYRAALESYGEALDLLERLGDRKGQAEYSKLRGSALLELGALEEAGKTLVGALELARQAEGGEIVAEVQVLMARLERLRGEPGQARNHLAPALLLAQQRNYAKTALRASIEDGILLAESGSRDEAQKKLQAVQREAELIGNVWIADEAGLHLVRLAVDRKNPSHALVLLPPLLRSAQRIGWKHQILRLNIEAARARLAAGQLDTADESFQAARKNLDQLRESCEKAYRPYLDSTPEAQLVQKHTGTGQMAEKVP